MATEAAPIFDTDELVINMGPQHPSTHGVLRIVLRLDGVLWLLYRLRRLLLVRLLADLRAALASAWAACCDAYRLDCAAAEGGDDSCTIDWRY